MIGPGLRAKMAASLVLATFAAAVLAGAAFYFLVAPRLVAGVDGGARVRATAAGDAATLSLLAGQLGRLPSAIDVRDQLARLAPGERNPICDRTLALAPGQARPAGAGMGVPCVRGLLDGGAPMSLMLLVAADGKVAASSYPGRFPLGARAAGLLPAESRAALARGAASGGLPGTTRHGGVLWALAPVARSGSPAAGAPARKALGTVYVQVPATGVGGPAARDLLGLLLPWGLSSGGGRLGQLGATAQPAQLGLALLLVTVPVGVLLGMLGGAGLRRRLRRLAAATAAMAGGDLRQRVVVSASDDVTEVEASVNRMAEWLSAELAARRQASDGDAADAGGQRLAEELRESVARELLSLTVLAGGLRKALPAGSPVASGVEAIESSATAALRQLRALLQGMGAEPPRDGGLVPALEELCDAYRSRFNLWVDADVATGPLSEPVERAVLQVAREALADAVEHREPRRVALRIAMNDRQVEVDVRDDGRGVDQRGGPGGREPGLDLLREWVGELGGTLRLERHPGAGTRLQVLLPRGPA